MKKHSWKNAVFILVFSCVVVGHHKYTQLIQGRQQIRSKLIYPESLVVVKETVISGQYVATYRARKAAGGLSREQVFRGK